MRFYIDKRVGCIAVRDRFKTDPGYQGLHRDTEDVVWFAMGIYDGGDWFVLPDDLEEAQRVCDRMNAEEQDQLAST